MRIERVDDKTVKCFISNEELSEHKVNYSDFLTRTDKAREMVHEIMEQAKEEVGYTPPKFAFDLQIMVLPEQGLLLTFSEKDPLEGKDGSNLLEYLKEMQKFATQGAASKEEKNEKTEEKARKEEPQAKPDKAIFCFSSIGDIMEFAQMLPKNLRVESKLYAEKDMYYLYLAKGGASYERYSRACIQAMEFSASFGANENQMLFLKEHAECLIEEQAIKKLRPTR